MSTDTFTYNNALDQLLTATNGGIIDTTAYSANGNINKRSGIGTYSYDAAKIHAVTNINYTCGAPHPKDSFLNKVYYTPFNQPDSIVEQNMRVGVAGNQYYSTYFTYSPDYLRTKMILKQGGAVKSTRYYVGNYEKLIDSAGTTRHLVYISGGNGLCAIASTIGSATTMYYVFTDHLGSILKMTDSLGNTVGEQSFDAWGRERNPKDWTKDTVTQPMGSPFESINSLYGYGNNAGFITRGYTGHESLPQFNLINMNGRLYDPTIGRMLSPDNFVADATNTQSYNRYTYVNNNPLNYTDPSGWLAAAWQEGNGDESNNISSSRARSGGGGFVMGNMSGFATMGWSSTFMQISSQYGTLAAMNAYSSGTISAINMARMNNTTTYVSFGMSGGQHHIRSQNNVGGAGEVTGKGELQMYSYTLFNNVNISQYMNTSQLGGGFIESIKSRIDNFFHTTKDNIKKVFQPGVIKFVNLNNDQLKEFQLLPETGDQPYTPTENKSYQSVDGYCTIHRDNDPNKYWYKIPNGYILTISYDIFFNKWHYDLLQYGAKKSNDAGWQSDKLDHPALKNVPFK